jgi:hypothetical protein
VIPAQGWKIHISSCLDNADDVLALAREYCIDRVISFKYLRSRLTLHMRNVKYAHRSGSGKFITIYPADDTELELILSPLGSLLKDQPGPFILSDLRYGAGPLYVRYGGFAERYCEDDRGELVTAIEDGRWPMPEKHVCSCLTTQHRACEPRRSRRSGWFGRIALPGDTARRIRRRCGPGRYLGRGAAIDRARPRVPVFRATRIARRGTCHLDPAAEARAERAFADRPGTLVIIAHRMSSALRARRVLLLDGDRADIGTHDSLLRRSALYRDLAGYWEGTAAGGGTRAAMSPAAGKTAAANMGGR